MDEAMNTRMRANLLRGIACVALGAMAIAAIELAWDAMTASAQDGGAPSADPGYGGMDFDDLAAYVLDDDDTVLGQACAPPGFDEECFDAGEFGEVRSSLEGGVVSIMSDSDAEAFFEECATLLKGRGWIQMDDGRDLRGTFLKSSGKYRWVFLEVSRIADISTAVMVFGDDAR